MRHSAAPCSIAATFSILAAVCAAPLARAAQDFQLRVVSSRADAVSGGDALVQMTAAQHNGWTALLNGADVTSLFRPAPGSPGGLALLSGLKLGSNTVEIRAHGSVRARLDILDHPLAGPIFSGPHQEPFICQTAINGLGPAQDADCSATAVIRYYYKTTQVARSSSALALIGMLGSPPGTPSPGFKPYDPSGPPPDDVAQTVTSEGRTVRYIVRREIGTINRAVYDIQFLHEPGDPLPSPWTQPNPGWNGRLVYVFGGGCGAGYHQGTLFGSVGMAQEPLLSQGYAVATSTLNIFQNNCNDRVSAETLSMVKEYFIKRFGNPVHTIGLGGSGGSVQLHLIAQNFPGLLDGLIVEASFPDQVSNARPKMDCPLLDHAFRTGNKHWTEEQKTAVSGFATWRLCADLLSTPLDDPRNCDRSIPKEMIYDRVANPGGLRCDIYDNEINMFGRDARTGFARNPFDNEGVQYGLVAFNTGKIDAEQFVALNESIGGRNADGEIVAARTVAAADSIDNIYRRGLILTGGGGLDQVPIIDWRSYADDQADRHTLFWSFVTRARLIAANGTADNQVIRVDARVSFPGLLVSADPSASLLARREHENLQLMNRWLDNIASDKTNDPPAVRISRNIPPDLGDGCWQADGKRIIERATYGVGGKCNQLYPAYGDPLLAAGAPLADDILKCALKPVSLSDYLQPLSAAQLARLRAVFPHGVCDYGRPGVGEQVTRETWQRETWQLDSTQAATPSVGVVYTSR
jgi:Tannase-like family of unknown function (DUF6351)